MEQPNDTYKNRIDPDLQPRVEKPDSEWRNLLDDNVYRITRGAGTEPAFTGEYNDLYDTGVFECIACGNDLFSSQAKYKSNSGWPSFWAPIEARRIELSTDTRHGMVRTEVRCSVCDSHLGHVFEDGPAPTGLRYCINSTSLHFVPANQ